MTSRGEEPRRERRDTPQERQLSDALENPEHRTERRTARTPWAFLILGVLVLALLLVGAIFLWRSLGDTLSATSTASDSLDSGPEPDIKFVNGPGQVRIEGIRDLEAIEYEVTKHAVARDPASAQQRASEVEVNVSREGSNFEIRTNGGRNTGADYHLRVPPGASIEVESEAGEVEVTGLSGNTAVAAEAGDAAVRDAGGSINIEAPMGDVEVSNVNTETGQVNLEVGSGDVDLTDLVIGTLEANIESGDASLSGRFSGGGRVLVHTGDIDVNLPSEDARDLSLEARIGRVERNENGEPDDENGSEQ